MLSSADCSSDTIANLLLAAAFLVEKKDAYTSTIDAPAEAQDGPKTPRISSRMFSASHA
jgi:hypothetical protein